MTTHDPNIARYCQRIINIQDGQIVNEENYEEVVRTPDHSLTSVATHKLRSFLTIWGW
jgi:ABC-type glutathione transport system ATPase component